MHIPLILGIREILLAALVSQGINVIIVLAYLWVVWPVTMDGWNAMHPVNVLSGQTVVLVSTALAYVWVISRLGLPENDKKEMNTRAYATGAIGSQVACLLLLAIYSALSETPR